MQQTALVCVSVYDLVSEISWIWEEIFMNRFKRILAVLLVFCMVCTFLPVTAGAAEVDPGKKGGIYDGEVTTLDVVNYYNATGVSVNGNFEVRGVAVDENGTAWCVLASTQANGDKHGFQTVSIAGKPTVEDPHYKNVIKPKGNAELTIKYPDGATETVIAQSNTFTKGQELYIIEIGTVADVLTSFELFIDSADNGWDILVQNPPVEINVEYDITKLVNGKESEEIERSKDDLANRTLTYTIQVKNTGDYAVYNANVNDIVPGNLSVQSVTAQILAPAGIAEAEPVEIHPAFDLETRKLALDTDITLPVGFVKEYTIVAVMDEDYTSGTFVNTAIIESDTLLPDQDEAPTTVKAYFYVHHIYNDGQKGVGEGEQMRVDTVEFSEELRDGAKFDVTTVNSAGTDYAGMWPETLYGGTFQENWTDVYPFENGENGIGFTPEINEHYYVWEPNEHYLRPANLSVWQPIPLDGYP